ncbi:MAG: class II fructose-bisphosphate aldolase, partial [Alphaproteobacteria bacterium]|nr:class II fructose-bisphosphate aldolase [Alphaproteobacteria bacterium]
EYAKQFNVSVEAELGALAGTEDDISHDKSVFTNPDEAKKFIELTGCDSLAISIGTSHGAYKGAAGTELKFDLLQQIHDAIPGVPLVLHGASSVPTELVEQINKYGGKLSDATGIPAEQLIRARTMGIAKINVDSDARLAFTAAVRKYLHDNPEEFDPRKYIGAARDAMTEMYIKKNTEVMGNG